MANNNKRNLAGPFIDLVKKINTSLGVVRDLHGNVFNPANQNLAQASKRGWYYIKVPYDRQLSLSELHDKAALSTDVGFLPIDSSGFADLASITEDVGANKAILLVAGLQTQASTRIALNINANNAGVMAYLNNTKLGEGSPKLDINSIMIQGGVTNLLQIVITRKRTGAFTVNFLSGSIKISADSSLVINLPPPETVQWDENAALIYGSLDSTVSSDGMILNWSKSPFVGGWLIEKNTYESLGTVISLVNSGSTGFDFVVSGTFSPADNVPVLVDEEYIGVVTDYTGLPGNKTTVNVLSPLVTSGDWVGSKMYSFKDTATLAEVEKKNTNNQELVVRYVDNNVVEKMPYTYRLFSWGLFDRSIISEPSFPATKLAFDETPPGPIVLYPNSIDAVSTYGDLVSVQHIYPEDPDLAGYRIYSSSGATLVVDLRRGNEYMMLDGVVPSGILTPPSRYGIFKFRAQELDGFDVQHIVSGYVVTTYDFAGNELPIVSGTYIDFTLLVDLVENFTSFDHVSSPTKTQRRPDGIPEHMWRTAIDILDANTLKAGYK